MADSIRKAASGHRPPANTDPEPRISICIPIPRRSQGGLYTFLDNFRMWLTRNSIRHTENMDDDYTILFVNSWVVPYETIRRVKKSRKYLRVVQRVNGSSKDYGRMDDADYRQARVSMLADLVVFQSEYSKYATTEKYKVITTEGPVVYNPVDTELFSPAEERRPHERVRIANISYSTNQKKGVWRIGQMAARYPEYDFVVCGNYTNLPDLPNVHKHGYVARAVLANVLRSCHLLVNLSENEACPNVVLEGLASGLPVIYLDSGGTGELVGDSGLALDEERFGLQVENLMTNHLEFSMAARKRSIQNFHPDVIFPQYYEAIANSLRKEMPTARQMVRLRIAGYPALPFSVNAIRRKARLWLGRRIGG